MAALKLLAFGVHLGIKGTFSILLWHSPPDLRESRELCHSMLIRWTNHYQKLHEAELVVYHRTPKFAGVFQNGLAYWRTSVICK